MEEFLVLFIDLIKNLLSKLNSVVIEAYGFQVSYLSIIGAFLVVSFVVTIFWKGARA